MSVLIISVLAKDRPGIVEQIADCITAHQGNWLESRLANLAGQFAGIIRAEVPPEQEAPLTGDLEALATHGINLTITVAESEVADTSRPGAIVTINVTGSDRAGIVREITALLAERGVSVQELASKCEHAPMSGDHLFQAVLTVQLPEQLNPEDLAEILETISDDLMIDLEH